VLRIYAAAHCPTYERTSLLIDFLQRRLPVSCIQVINLDAGNVEIPDYVFCTPTYVWEDRVIFLGNPSKEELVERLDQNTSVPAQERAE
jgi:hypothetical protein